ncbi:MAG TPA: DUF4145 domain-containing protein [bacterium]
MIIECPACEAKVDAKVLAKRVYPPTDECEPCMYTFLECPSCNNVLVGYSEEMYCGGGESKWENPWRLWPEPPHVFHGDIPQLVRDSLRDAQKCLKANVYPASAVMCRRALEAICKDKTGKKTLYEGLKKLKEKELIDDRLYSWGEALRQEGNIGAHATEEIILKQDAQDILDFALAITDYIYVLTEKFNKYQSRRKKTHKKLEK